MLASRSERRTALFAEILIIPTTATNPATAARFRSELVIVDASVLHTNHLKFLR